MYALHAGPVYMLLCTCVMCEEYGCAALKQNCCYAWLLFRCVSQGKSWPSSAVLCGLHALTQGTEHVVVHSGVS